MSHGAGMSHIGFLAIFHVMLKLRSEENLFIINNPHKTLMINKMLFILRFFMHILPSRWMAAGTKGIFYLGYSVAIEASNSRTLFSGHVETPTNISYEMQILGVSFRTRNELNHKIIFKVGT